MPPSVALVLAFAVIVFLFRLDPARARVSPALWIPTIWFMILGSRMVSEWFHLSESLESIDRYAEGNPLDRNIFLVLIATGVAVLIKRRISLAGIISRNIWLTLFLMYSGLSIAWSDFPFVACKRYFKEIGDLVMVALVLTERDRIEAVGTLLKRCAFVLIPLSIVLYKYYPALGRGYGFWLGELYVIGVTNNKNSLGVLSLVCGMGLLWRMLEARSGNGLSRPMLRTLTASGAVFSMAIWTLIVSRSATSLACFMVGTAVLSAAPLLRRSMAMTFVCCVLGLCGVLLTEALLGGGGVINTAVTGLGRDTTLTGRTDVWNDVLAMHTNPLVGVGFGSFWLGDRMAFLWQTYHWHPTEAHNGYLDVYLELGFVGLFLLAGTIVTAFYTTLRSFVKNVAFERLRLALLVVVLLYNVTESAFRVDLLMYCVFLLIAVDATRAGSMHARSGAPARLPWRAPVSPIRPPATVPRHPISASAPGRRHSQWTGVCELPSTGRRRCAPAAAMERLVRFGFIGSPV
jgi:exopolysaccharide production protein ExoQ